MLAKPAILLRIEGAAVFALSLGLYHSGGVSWKVFLLLFLWPDLGMLGYLRGERLGATTYNLVHNEVLPILLAGIAIERHWMGWPSFAFIWAAHIGFDRLLGYGLKYPTAFKDTHLQRVS
jgi:Domain of unknown function (DUF4260)